MGDGKGPPAGPPWGEGEEPLRAISRTVTSPLASTLAHLSFVPRPPAREVSTTSSDPHAANPSFSPRRADGATGRPQSLSHLPQAVGKETRATGLNSCRAWGGRQLPAHPSQRAYLPATASPWASKPRR